jgi:hypothetical protein
MLSLADVEALRASRSVELATVQLAAAAPVAEIASSREAAEVNAFIDSQPDEVARMLRVWVQPAGKAQQ